jgi:hypothetical protein
VGFVVAWERDVPDYDFIGKYSLQHVVRQVGENASDAGDYALCGARIRWLYISPGDSRRCPRCFAAAVKAGMVNDWGTAIGDDFGAGVSSDF